MNIMTFPWSRGADCRSFTAWLLNFTGRYLPTSPIRDSCSNLSLTKKSAHLVVGFVMIHGNQRHPQASLHRDPSTISRLYAAYALARWRPDFSTVSYFSPRATLSSSGTCRIV